MAKILIVDDEPALLQAYARILASASHDIVSAFKDNVAKMAAGGRPAPAGPGSGKPPGC